MSVTVLPWVDSMPSFPHSKTEKLCLPSVFNLEYFSHTELCLLLQNNLTYISTPTLAQSEGSSGLKSGLQVSRRCVENKCKKQGKCRAIHSLIYPPSLLPFLVVKPSCSIGRESQLFTLSPVPLLLHNTELRSWKTSMIWNTFRALL